jgi:hypothetical protein
VVTGWQVQAQPNFKTADVDKFVIKNQNQIASVKPPEPKTAGVAPPDYKPVGKSATVGTFSEESLLAAQKKAFAMVDAQNHAMAKYAKPAAQWQKFVDAGYVLTSSAKIDESVNTVVYSCPLRAMTDKQIKVSMFGKDRCFDKSKLDDYKTTSPATVQLTMSKVQAQKWKLL